MSDISEFQKLAVEKYLDQVKLLTTISTALLLSPSVVVSILNIYASGEDTPPPIEAGSYLFNLFLGANMAFLLAIFLTYLIYSSIVGLLIEDKVDINNGWTRFWSLLQVGAFFAGSVCLLLFFLGLLKGG